jgi:hypothetical protein
LAGAASEPPWRRGTGGGRGGDESPPRSTPPSNGGRLLIFKRDVREAHQVKLLSRDKGTLRTPEQAELQAAYLHLNQAVNWRAAKIKPVATQSDTLTSFELVVPREAAVTPSADLTGRLDIRWTDAVNQADRKAAETEANLVSGFNGSFREGIQQLIDRLRNLKFKGKVKDVQFFFQTSAFDAVITENLESSIGPKRG